MCLPTISSVQFRRHDRTRSGSRRAVGTAGCPSGRSGPDQFLVRPVPSYSEYRPLTMAYALLGAFQAAAVRYASARPGREGGAAHGRARTAGEGAVCRPSAGAASRPFARRIAAGLLGIGDDFALCRRHLGKCSSSLPERTYQRASLVNISGKPRYRTFNPPTTGLSVTHVALRNPDAGLQSITLTSFRHDRYRFAI